MEAVEEAKRRAIDETVAHLNNGYRLILNSNMPLRIGSQERIWHAGPGLTEIEQPITILRESTFEEWQANLPPDAPGRDRTAGDCNGAYFYEAILD